MNTSEVKINPQMVFRSKVFSWYNRARTVARQGKGNLDEARINRALGLLLNGKAQERWIKYGTQVGSCGCPDSRKNGGLVCKHRVAMMMAVRIRENQPSQDYLKRQLEKYDLEMKELFKRNAKCFTPQQAARLAEMKAEKFSMRKLSREEWAEVGVQVPNTMDFVLS